MAVQGLAGLGPTGCCVLRDDLAALFGADELALELQGSQTRESWKTAGLLRYGKLCSCLFRYVQHGVILGCTLVLEAITGQLQVMIGDSRGDVGTKISTVMCEIGTQRTTARQ